MDDQFLNDMRREPPADYARRLRIELDDMDRQRGWFGFSPAVTRWASAAASVAVVAVAFSLPSVRAGAQQFLDLFRVLNVAAVSVDLSALEGVSFEGIDFGAMIGENDVVGTEPEPPVSYGSNEEAAAAAGYAIREPAWLPVGWDQASIEVAGAQAYQLTARTELLELVLEQLQITDLTVPASLDGAQVSVSVPPVTRTSYFNGAIGDNGASFNLVQAPTPEIVFPADVQPATLAEIGLRIMGLDPDQAYDLAWTVDWRSTLMIPVPAQEASFDKVTVRGSDGVLIVPNGGRGAAMLMWATDDRVYALAKEPGPGIDQSELLILAESIQ